MAKTKVQSEVGDWVYPKKSSRSRRGKGGKEEIRNAEKKKARYAIVHVCMYITLLLYLRKKAMTETIDRGWTRSHTLNFSQQP